VLVKCRVLALLVGCGDKLVALVLEPLADSKLVFRCSEKLGLVLCVLKSLRVLCQQVDFEDPSRQFIDLLD